MSASPRRRIDRSGRSARTASGRRERATVHDGYGVFGSATKGPMRRDYKLKRFLALSSKYRLR
jgi:hypothetical protein